MTEPEAGPNGELGTYSFKDHYQGNPLFHPPIPGDSTRITSTRQPDYVKTGDQPGPYAPLGGPPRDPRLVYPRIIANTRPVGQGCSSCRWNGCCKLLFWQLNFGNLQEDQTGPNGTRTLPTSIGRACESWNYDFDQLLPPGSYNNDGLGMGDPYAAGTIPPEALDPTRYDGQWGDMRSPGSTNPSTERS
jgi:hypothetical protein